MSNALRFQSLGFLLYWSALQLLFVVPMQADVVSPIPVSVPYDWDFRIPGLPHTIGDQIRVSLEYRRIGSPFKEVAEDWKAVVKITCPHGNLVKREYFRLIDDVGEQDSAIVIDTIREAGKFTISALVYPQLEKQRSSRGGPIVTQSWKYTNLSRTLTWTINRPKEIEAAWVDSCWYANHNKTIDPYSMQQ